MSYRDRCMDCGHVDEFEFVNPFQTGCDKCGSTNVRRWKLSEEPHIKPECNHDWRYFNHFGGQKRECTKCLYRDPDYYIPNYYK